MLLFEFQIAFANIVKKSSHCQRLFEIYYQKFSLLLFSTVSKCRILYSLSENVLKKLFMMEFSFNCRRSIAAVM